MYQIVFRKSLFSFMVLLIFFSMACFNKTSSNNNGPHAYLSIDKESITIISNTSANITVTAQKTDATDDTISAISSDTETATVSVSGLVVTVTGSKTGNAIITITSGSGLSKTCAVIVNSKAGSLDLSFDPGSGPNGNIWEAVVQNDGKIIIVGNFTSYNGKPRNGIARINTDGTLDASFDPGSTVNDRIFTGVTEQDDGTILIRGAFTACNGIPRNGFARLHSDGSVDTSFSLGTVDGAIYSFKKQNDGKLLFSWYSSTYNGSSCTSLARINVDTSLDTTFDPGTGPNRHFSTYCLQEDGKILIGGKFTQYNGVSRNYIARINADGSLDAGFDPGTGFLPIGTSTVEFQKYIIQNDGKILIQGSSDGYGFLGYNGIARKNFLRIHADASLDIGFDPASNVDGDIASTALQSDGKIVIGGNFATYNGTGRKNIARINADGSLDSSFDPAAGSNGVIALIVIQSDGKLLIIGSFTSYTDIPRKFIARINGD